MKKVQLLIVCLGILISSQGFSQISHEIGVQGGPSIRYLFKDYDTNYPAGGTIGLNYQLNINAFFSIRSEINYELKGNSWTFISVDPMYPSPKQFNNFNYLTFPVLARFNFGKKHKFFFNTGPYLGYLLSAKQFMKDAEPEFSAKTVVTQDFKRFDFGLSSSLGAIIQINKHFALPIELRFNASLAGNPEQNNFFDGFGPWYGPVHSVQFTVGFAYHFNP